jgi:hypothetical protein
MTPLETILLVLVILLLVVLIGIGVVLILVIKRLMWTLAKFTVITEMVDKVVEKATSVLGNRKSREKN